MTAHDEAVRMLSDTVAALQQSKTNLEAALAAISPKPAERLATPAGMEPGGWVRLPGQRRWWQITTVVCGHPTQSVIEYRCGRATHTYDVLPWETLPYHTDAELAAIDAGQAAEDDALDRLQFAEWEAGR